MAQAVARAEERPLGVSVCCITYNHAPYIARALDSFLAQVADVPIEVLVHDDCSTDGTVDILRSYERRYPDVVRVVYEERNQWNPNARYIARTLLPLARYRYFAMCEGDDHWTEPTKLARQVAYLEEHPTCSMAVHQARIVNAVSGEDLGLMGYGDTPRDVDQAYVLAHWAKPDAIPTASAVCRVAVEERYDAAWNFPRVMGDLCRASFYAGEGYIHYDPLVGCAYLSGVPGSYSSGFARTWVDPVRELASLRFFKDLDEHTGGCCHDLLMRKGAMRARTVAAVVGVRRFFSSPLGKPYLRYLSPRDVVLGVGTRALVLAGRVPALSFEQGRTVVRRMTDDERAGFAAFRAGFAKEASDGR